jgi:ABC-type antimicrobial peptide transport system permease subunit
MSTLLTLLGIAVGAILTYIFTRSHEQEKHYRLLKTGAYADYLRCVAEAAHLSLRSDEADLFARAADAKTRICLYGSQEVITLLAVFEKEGGIIGNAQQRSAFVRLVQSMRGNLTVQISDIEVILFGRAT